MTDADARSGAAPGRAAKEWASLRARLALLGVAAFRTDDAPPRFFTIGGSGIPRMHPDLHAVRKRIEEIVTGGGSG